MDGKKIIEIDPDYEANNLAIRRVELKSGNDADKSISEKLVKIIEDEFDKELYQRQEQTERIEEQIYKTQKLLHALRYVLISSYYKNTTLEYEKSEASSSTGATDLNSIFDGQNRLHPAIKKLCGSNSNPLEIISTPVGKRKSRSTALSSKYDNFDMEQPEMKKCKNAPPTTTTTTTSVESESRLNNDEIVEMGEIVKNRHKIKRKLVVGNISKWTPTLEDDNLTHKWMVYVRSAKGEVDVCTFVEKVVFYLHPSYKPHDVVEVCKSPFHLSRRGWGEFPIRVQVFFKNQLNKPVDIVHNLKLDQTFSGRQTLGNETLVDLFLHDDHPARNILIPPDEIKLELNDELSSIKSEPVDNEFENDFDRDKDFDHSYCNLEGKVSQTLVTKPADIDQDKSNRLIYGLENYLLSSPTKATTKTTNSSLNNANVNKILLKNLSTGNKSICILPHSLNKLLLANGNLLTLKLKPEIFGSLSSQLSSSVELSSQAKSRKLLEIPGNRFKNMGEVLPYLFKKLPLCSELAEDNSYKCLYPFTARTFDEYSSWYLAKRLNAEWCRAKTILKILKSHQFFESDKWNTKALILYGRSHQFTTLVPLEIFNKYSPEIDLVLTCFANTDPNFRKAKQNPKDDTAEIDIDDSLRAHSPVKEEQIDVTDPVLKLHCAFIKQTALDCNIVLKNEEMMKNVLFNGAERIMLEAMKSFAENVIRRAATHLITKGNISLNESSISQENVQTALRERPEFEQIVKFRKRKREIDYFL